MPATFVDERRRGGSTVVERERERARFEVDEEMETLSRNPHRIADEATALRVAVYLRSKADVIRTQLVTAEEDGWDEQPGWRQRAERALASTERLVGRVRWMLREMRRGRGVVVAADEAAVEAMD